MSIETTAAPVWRKSSRSNDQSLGCCVEVAAIGAARAVRDSKNPGGPRLSLSAAEWRSFVADIKGDAYEL